ncbi:jg26490 [Pararge aegeria aegeria]|uniref:Jg26490 protein n=1 Tax=Pararge aegeria aegeria TaxID=348720 RepID=A0A8S4S097_9NEOP|nr:jg26490 [Pararge aegeria aegeria]
MSTIVEAKPSPWRNLLFLFYPLTSTSGHSGQWWCGQQGGGYNGGGGGGGGNGGGCGRGGCGGGTTNNIGNGRHNINTVHMYG